LASPLIQRLREKEAEIIRTASQLTVTFGPRHPRVQSVAMELEDVQRSIDAEVQKIAQALANEARVALMRENSLIAEVREVERQAAESAKAEVKYQQLKRQADTVRALYETFLTRYNQTAVQDDEVPAADARIISPADVPETPAFPDMARMSGTATALSFVLAVAWVGFRERPGQTFRNAVQVQRATGLPTLALVPQIPRRFRRNAVLDRQKSVYAESLRSLIASLRLADGEEAGGGRVIMVASAGQGEGKSLLAFSLARTLAALGQRVALVDADIRRPSLHSYLRLSRAPGLSDHLDDSTGTIDLHRDERTGMMFLPAGKPNIKASNLLGSAAFADALRTLAAEHDAVIVDTPPVLAAVDARLIATVAHRVIYAVRWGETSREAAIEGLRLLEMAGGSVAGVVLTQVNWRQHTAYEDREMFKYYGARAI
jgi:capsular exopolysaccharide synthesis family protein